MRQTSIKYKMAMDLKFMPRWIENFAGEIEKKE